MEEQEEEDLKEYLKKILKEEELIENKEKALEKILPDYKSRDNPGYIKNILLLKLQNQLPKNIFFSKRKKICLNHSKKFHYL